MYPFLQVNLTHNNLSLLHESDSSQSDSEDSDLYQLEDDQIVTLPRVSIKKQHQKLTKSAAVLISQGYDCI